MAAAARYREAAKADPDHASIQVNLAVALLRVGQWTEGLDRLHAVWLRDSANQQLTTALKDALAQAPKSVVPSWKDTVR